MEVWLVTLDTPNNGLYTAVFDSEEKAINDIYGYVQEYYNQTLPVGEIDIETLESHDTKLEAIEYYFEYIQESLMNYEGYSIEKTFVQ